MNTNAHVVTVCFEGKNNIFFGQGVGAGEGNIPAHHQKWRLVRYKSIYTALSTGVPIFTVEAWRDYEFILLLQSQGVEQ